MPRVRSTFFLTFFVAVTAGCEGEGGPVIVDAQASSLCANAAMNIPGTTPLVRCCGDVAQQVPASLASDVCEASVAFALCDGIHFECQPVCALPAGFTVLAAGAKQNCSREAAVVDAPSATPVPFDGGGLRLGPCSGDVVALILAAACPNHCLGSLAYAVCEGDTYADCACNIPPGYSLVGLTDGSAFDAGADAPAMTKEGGGG